MTNKAYVGIIMGSASDREIMQKAADVLTQFEIPFEMRVASAHRIPEAVADYAKSASDRGLRVLIAGAGASAALPGVVAADTSLPVIGVPLNATALGGMDALLSIAQMPAGVPVATMAIGAAGAKNAAFFAARIIALNDARVTQAMHQQKLTESRKLLDAMIIAES
jgi:5-(carboxyamino)imidazole ribonucleotide mutase